MAIAAGGAVGPLHPFSSFSNTNSYVPIVSPYCCIQPFPPQTRCNNNQNNSATSNVSVADMVLRDIQNSGIIACLRAPSADVAIEAARAAFRGGISVLEVTMSTPGVFEVLQHLVLEYPSASIGVGTVLRRSDAENALKFGAMFLMSPVMVKGILDDVSKDHALYIPGAMTPTEILSAYDAGAKIIKVYPISALGGVQYIAAIKKPFSHIPLVASQGIAIDSVGCYLAQGASSVVLSDAIFDRKAMERRDFVHINKLASVAVLKGNVALWSAKA